MKLDSGAVGLSMNSSSALKVWHAVFHVVQRIGHSLVTEQLRAV